ncbi:hypothetical protein MTO96_028496 [Rhipicephalus appendiculatus]
MGEPSEQFHRVANSCELRSGWLTRSCASGSRRSHKAGGEQHVEQLARRQTLAQGVPPWRRGSRASTPRTAPALERATRCPASGGGTTGRPAPVLRAGRPGSPGAGAVR